MELLEVKDLKVYYYSNAGLVKAVDDVGFTLGKKQTLGIVGESGSGKSTLGFSIMRLVPTPGRIVGGSIFFDQENLLLKSEDEMRKIRGRRIGMVFQDPMTSLNPLMRIGDHIVETIIRHQTATKEQAMKRVEALLERLGISKTRIDDYPHQFSGGMRQRIMIGLALALNPDIVIADEPTTSLDVIVEAQIVELMRQLKRDFESSMVLITHNMGIVAELADTVVVMYAGKMMEISDSVSLYENPLHPYTKALLRSIPNIRLASQELTFIPGLPPDLINPPKGCRFQPRCKYAMPRCAEEEPPLIKLETTRRVACFLHGG